MQHFDEIERGLSTNSQEFNEICPRHPRRIITGPIFGIKYGYRLLGSGIECIYLLWELNTKNEDLFYERSGLEEEKLNGGSKCLYVTTKEHKIKLYIMGKENSDKCDIILPLCNYDDLAAFETDFNKCSVINSAIFFNEEDRTQAISSLLENGELFNLSKRLMKSSVTDKIKELEERLSSLKQRELAIDQAKVPNLRQL